MKNLLTIVSILLISTIAFAQGEYNNWCFGDGNLLDFNSGSPVHSTSSINTIWASSTFSDRNGNLLFYAQPDTVWDANHNLMLNGDSIMGTEIPQGVNVLPFPCNDSLYYLFTVLNDVAQPQGINFLYYSIINMNGNNGLGEVIVKNILLDSNIANGFAMTRHGNNMDYWITYRLGDTNIFSTRQISSAGIGTPINSQIGVNQSGFGMGSLEFSSDGSTLINISASPIFAQGLSFNNSTGVLSNNYTFSFPSFNNSWPFPMSCQFSPDLSKLYISGSYWLVQFDYSSGNISTITNSGIIIAQSASNPTIPSTWYFNDIALGPDNKLYISRSSQQFLGAISQPNNLGPSCGFINQAVLTTGHWTGYGLPTFLPNLFVDRDILTDSLLCQYDTINLYLSDTNFIDSLVWDFGDPSSGVLNTSTDVLPLHVYNTYGIYPIEVIIYSGCVNDTIYDTIRINPTPIANLGPDTILCEGDSMQMLFNDTSFNYLWGTGDTSMSIQILHADTFSIAISSICGTDFDTIVIDSLIAALVHLPNDTLLCSGDSLLLDATIQSGTYVWNIPITDSTYWVNDSGAYSVTATNFCGTDSDTIVVSYTHPPFFDFGNDTSLCVSDTLVLNAWDTLSTFLWNSGDTFSLDTITTTGIYSATTTNLCGSHSDTIEVWFLSPPTAYLGNDTVLCLGDSILLSDTTLFGTYNWNTTAITDTITVLTPGTYQLTVTNICGVASDAIAVDFDTIPTVDLGNDTVICNGDSVLLSADFSRSSFIWSTGSTDSAISVTTQNTYWATATNLCGLGSDTIFVDVDSVLMVDLGADTILCLGTSYWLLSNVNGTSYLWNTGSNLDSIFIQTDNNYSLTVTNVCGSFDDSIAVHYDNSPITNLGPDSTYCLSSLVNLNAYWSRAQYLWNTADTTSNITANFNGNYSVLVTNLCGFDGDTVNIQYDIPIVFNLGPDTVLCVGDSFLIAAPAHNATWLWGDGSQDSILVVNNGGQFYVTSNNHCGAFSDSIKVVSETLPVINPAILDTAFCDGETFDVLVAKNNATSILWLNGSNSYSQSFDSTGWYSYSLRNICGATSDTFRLDIQYLADAFLGNDTVICYGEQIVKSFDYPNHSYLWNNGLTDSFQIITATGIYGITIFTPALCESYSEILVESCNAQLFIPNAFTPDNGDQLNNTFKVQGEGIRKYRIAIFDRWGMMVFESFDLENSWNGLVNGNPVQAGLYSYKIWYNTGMSSESVTRIGSVTLLR